MGAEVEKAREERDRSQRRGLGTADPCPLGPPSQLRFACAADFSPRPCPLTSSSPPPPGKKAVPCPLYQLGLAPGGWGWDWQSWARVTFHLSCLASPSSLPITLAWSEGEH